MLRKSHKKILLFLLTYTGRCAIISLQGDDIMPRQKSENSTFNKTVYKREYGHAKYDRITVYVPKGKREKINVFASLNNTTANDLIKTLLDEYMERWQREHPDVDLDDLTQKVVEEKQKYSD